MALDFFLASDECVLTLVQSLSAGEPDGKSSVPIDRIISDGTDRATNGRKDRPKDA